MNVWKVNTHWIVFPTCVHFYFPKHSHSKETNSIQCLSIRNITCTNSPEKIKSNTKREKENKTINDVRVHLNGNRNGLPRRQYVLTLERGNIALVGSVQYLY